MSTKKVQALLLRMTESSQDPNTLKTCCGALTILSRTESNKTKIVRDGLILIFQSMRNHPSNVELLETCCDLLWSLAFNNNAVKQVMRQQGGIKIILECMEVHIKSAELVKSALGVLSNLSQVVENQNEIGKEKGIESVLYVIRVHRMNDSLLPLALDTFASMVVNHIPNTNQSHQKGSIKLILELLQTHIDSSLVLKSGFHVMAILSDVSHVAIEIMKQNGIAIILNSLSKYPKYLELQKLCTILMLRMINENDHVVLEQLLIQHGMERLFHIMVICENNMDTISAACHLLYEITTFANKQKMDLMPYLPRNTCKSEILIHAATIYSSNFNLVRAIFCIFANCARNIISSLEHFVNMTIMEELLELKLIVPCKTNELGDSLSIYICSLRKTSIQIYTLEKEEKTTSSLLSCLSEHPHNSSLIASIFLILKKWWQQEDSNNNNNYNQNNKVSSQVLFGFIAAAIRCLSRSSLSNLPSLQEIQNVIHFLYIVIMNEENHSQKKINGKQSVISCGGKIVLENFQKDIQQQQGNQEIKQMIHSMVEKLSSFSSLMLLSQNNTISNEKQQQQQQQHPKQEEEKKPKETNTTSLKIKSNQKEKKQYNYNDDDNHNNEDEWENVPSEGSDDVKSSSSIPLNKHTNLVSLLSEKEDSSSLLSSLKFLPSLECLIEKEFCYINQHGQCLPKHPLSAYYTKHISLPLKKSLHSSSSSLNLKSPSFLEPQSSSSLSSSSSSSSSSISNWISKSLRRNESFINYPEEIKARIVFQNQSAAGQSIQSKIPLEYPYELISSSISFNPNLIFPNSCPLTFDSHFESGNLLRAIQVDDYEYDLVLRNDLHSSCYYTQWFYFAISNNEGCNAQKYRFNIINLCKLDSLFNEGLKPVVYSVKNACINQETWIREGQDICYYKNPFLKQQRNNDLNDFYYYTLSFTLSFENKQDTYLIAHSYPYTTQDHQNHMDVLMNSKEKKEIVKRSCLCRTLSGLSVDVLTITDNFFLNEMEQRKIIVFSARVHPGEAQASWMMRGIIDFLVSDEIIAKCLRRLYVFKIIPMLNPDGVKYGNNRCNLAAVDLNRQWKKPNKELHPTIYATKQLIIHEQIHQQVLFYIDIHGHSKKKNVFMYGCENNPKKKNSTKKILIQNNNVRLFPKILSCNRIGKRYVSYQDCSFHANKTRDSTARVVVSRDLNIINSFTLEASFCGANFGELNRMHFNTFHLQQVGIALCESIFEYSLPDNILRQQLLQKIHENINSFDILDYVQKNQTSPLTLFDNEIKIKKKKLKQNKSNTSNNGVSFIIDGRFEDLQTLLHETHLTASNSNSRLSSSSSSIKSKNSSFQYSEFEHISSSLLKAREMKQLIHGEGENYTYASRNSLLLGTVSNTPKRASTATFGRRKTRRSLNSLDIKNNESKRNSSVVLPSLKR